VADGVRSLAGLLVLPTDDGAPVAFRRDQAAARDRVHTRAEWVSEIAQLCARLRADGLAAGARIALHDDDPWAFSIGLMACWQVGAVAVLPPNVQPGSLDRLRESVDAAIGAGGAWLPGLPGFPAVAGAEPRDDPRTRLDHANQLDLAGLDHVEVVAALALVEDHLARRERPLVVAL